ncbi:PBP1A family penicillin-binding protein [Clostridium sp. CTA-19]
MSEKKPTVENKNNKTSRKKILKGIFIVFIILFLSCAAIGTGVVYGMIKTAPTIDVEKFLDIEETSTIYDSKSNLIDEFLTPERRISIDIDKTSENLKDAFVSIEDERFYSHKGIDFRRIGGAIFQDVKIIFGMSEGNLQGASTITQQLVKYRYFLEDSLENRTSIKRKVQEMYLSLKLEKELSKGEILESYMNTIYLGGTSHGVEAASQMYFNKSSKDLTLKQSAFIAGAAQNPSVSYYNAYENFKNNIPFDSPRTKTVLDKMLELGKITNSEYDAAIEDPLTFDFNINSNNGMNFEYFSRPAINQVVDDMVEIYKISKSEALDKLMYGGYKVYTTMDTELQNEVQEIVNDSNGSILNIYDNPNLQASATIIDYKTGDVKCIVGGRGEQEPNSYNRAASENFLRSPGSSLKPLTVYAPAINEQILTAGSMIEDSPIPTSIGSKYGNPPYDPKNAQLDYEGYMTLRDSIRSSRNTVATKVTDTIGLATSAKYGENFGIQLDETDKSSISALALGQLDGGSLAGTNPLALSAAYGTFGNNGVYTKPRLYTKVLDRHGKVILENKIETNTVLSSQASYIVYDMLKEPVIGTGPSAAFGNMEVRGKTGTSSDSTDLTFAGLTPYLSAAVWIGNDDYTPIYNMNSDKPAALWGRVMAAAHKSLEYSELARPDGIVSVDICKDSGTLPTQLSYKDPRGNRVYSELFIEGTQPSSLDNIHVESQYVLGADGKYYLPSENTPKNKIKTGVFITRDYYPYVFLNDSKWLVPTETDPTSYKTNDKDKNNDKNKDKDKNSNSNKDKNKSSNRKLF